jgi:hypothetical protein
MKSLEIKRLMEQCADWPDKRVKGRTAHDWLDIVAMSLCAVRSGAQGWDDIEDWGREREAGLRGCLRLENGIPGHDTIRRVFESISPLELGMDGGNVSGGEWARDRHGWQGALRHGARQKRLAGAASGVGLCHRMRPDPWATKLR